MILSISKTGFFIFLALIMFILAFALFYFIFIKRSTEEEVAFSSQQEISETIDPIIEKETTLKDQSVIQYKKGKCLIINRFDCPSSWGPATVRDCEEQLDVCEEKHKALQKFCNPYCEEELESCQEELYRTKSSWFNNISYFRPMYQM